MSRLVSFKTHQAPDATETNVNLYHDLWILWKHVNEISPEDHSISIMDNVYAKAFYYSLSYLNSHRADSRMKFGSEQAEYSTIGLNDTNVNLVTSPTCILRDVVVLMQCFQRAVTETITGADPQFHIYIARYQNGDKSISEACIRYVTNSLVKTIVEKTKRFISSFIEHNNFTRSREASSRRPSFLTPRHSPPPRSESSCSSHSSLGSSSSSSTGYQDATLDDYVNRRQAIADLYRTGGKFGGPFKITNTPESISAEDGGANLIRRNINSRQSLTSVCMEEFKPGHQWRSGISLKNGTTGSIEIKSKQGYSNSRILSLFQ
jgi:hypothetical protein